MGRGFTLIELSIVLVIIGLLIGGILVGQSLVTSAKVKAQIQQISQFDIAGRNFYAKYKYIPGDAPYNFLAGATNIGDGNGVINDADGTVPPISSWKENYLYFIMLTNAESFPTKLKYIADTRQIGVTHPKSAIGRGGIGITGSAAGDVYYLIGLMRNSVGTYPGNYYTYHSAEGILSPSEALEIDTKMDDGKPGTGFIASVSSGVNTTGSPYPMVRNVAANDCSTAGTDYNVARSETNLCRLLVKADIRK